MRALLRSPAAPQLLCAPGNPGIAADAQLFPVAVDDVPGIVALARDEEVGLVVVGPEAPLVAGVVDALTDAGIPVFGPGRDAARLEGSKAFAKEVMEAAGVPTAAWTTVDDAAAGMAAIERYPVVLKFDGLAAGKGVVIAQDEAQAQAALTEFLEERRFGPGRVVVEEHLDGEEVSLLALCDGVRAIPMAPAQDYKRIFDGDEGPNTGGMGSYSPVPGVDAARARRAVGRGAPADRGRARAARHPVPRCPLRRDHAHGGRPAGARVQRALRRSRDPGGAPAPAQRPRRADGRGGPSRRSRRRSARLRPAHGGHARARVRRLPGRAPQRRPDHAAWAPSRRTSRSPTRAPRSRASSS